VLINTPTRSPLLKETKAGKPTKKGTKMTYDLVAFELETNKEVLNWFGVLATRRFRAGT